MFTNIVATAMSHDEDNVKPEHAAAVAQQLRTLATYLVGKASEQVERTAAEREALQIAAAFCRTGATNLERTARGKLQIYPDSCSPEAP